MFHPWLGPLMFASASTIALRTLLLTPVDGRFTPWQVNESQRMIHEKFAALHEAQVEAASVAWRLWLASWNGPAATRRSARAGAATVAQPFVRRARANARRLGGKAGKPLAVAPMVAPIQTAARLAADWPGTGLIPRALVPAPPRRRRR
jgi:hypothetical protein